MTEPDPDATLLRADPADPDATRIRPLGSVDPEATRIQAAQPLPPNLPAVLPAGERLLEYRIESLLGQGGFGITYLATDVHLATPVAIKEYLPAQLAQRAGDRSIRPRRSRDLQPLLEGLEQFLVEARLLASFRHPHIVRVLRFFEAHRSAYMVLDYERGSSLRQWWLQGEARTPRALPEAELALLLAPLLDGLEQVHRQGVLHRDIKPDNLLVRDDGGGLVLIDFGAAAQGDAASAPQLLTPGYAPPEQYRGGAQGPWTDLYALAATLYWLVAGERPPEAPEREADPGCYRPALQAGAGRYGEPFLRAIDWGLQLHPADRPASVAAFRRALLAGHAESLNLQQLLAARGDGAPAAPNAPRWSWRRPGGWPLAAKLAALLVAVALAPMALTAQLNYQHSVAALAAAERRSLEQLAQATAGRLAQLFDDHQRLGAFLAREPELLALLRAADGGATPAAALRDAVQRRLGTLVATQPDLHLATLMDREGRALLSTAPEVVGGQYAFRDYFQQALAGRPVVTSMLIGAVAGRAGSYLSQPVRDGDTVLGVLVLRVRAERIGELVEAAGDRRHGREAWLLDADGVLIHHPDPARRFHSLRPLSEAQQAAIRADQRFRRDRIPSLGDAGGDAMLGLEEARRAGRGQAEYQSPISAGPEVAGLAAVPGPGWQVVVSESRASFEAPLREQRQQVLLALAGVGLLALGLAALLARRLVRPIQALSQAVDALKRGDYAAAQVKVERGDELGRLGRGFNVMIEVLRQRERERQLRKR